MLYHCGVTEVDGAMLVAVPEALWDRMKAKRLLPVDALRKADGARLPTKIAPLRSPSPASKFGLAF